VTLILNLNLLEYHVLIVYINIYFLHEFIFIL